MKRESKTENRKNCRELVDKVFDGLQGPSRKELYRDVEQRYVVLKESKSRRFEETRQKNRSLVITKNLCRVHPYKRNPNLFRAAMILLSF